VANKKKRPTLRFDGRYWVATIYKPPHNTRGTVSFGSPAEREEKDIRIAFEMWWDLFQKMPHKVLSYDSPYEAIEQITNPTTVTTIGQLLEKYENYLQKTVSTIRYGLEHPDLRFVRRVRLFLEPYAQWDVNTFGPDELNEVKGELLKYKYTTGKKKKHYTRGGINDTLGWVIKIIRWGVGRRIVEQETLICINNEFKKLRYGEQGAKDTIKRTRVTEEEFRKVVSCVNSVHADMLTLIWHTGMRPYEICEMRPFDILTDDPECWIYIPGRDKTPVGMHKTTIHGKIKVIPLAGECIDILKRRVKNFTSKQYIFSPKESMAEYLAEKHRNRKTPLSCGNKPGSNRKEDPARRAGDRFINSTFERACKRGCKKAEVEPFVPYDLRRTVATKTRAELGKEAARTLLGHAKTSTTDIYLLEEVTAAMKVAKALAALSLQSQS